MPISNWSPPEPNAPRVSLLTSVPVLTGADLGEGERWASGFEYETVGCGDSGLWRICGQPDEETKELPTGSLSSSGDAFTVYAVDRCSTFGRRDHEKFARAKLEATQSRSIEQQLWDNVLLLDTPSLVSTASDVTPSGGAVSPAVGLKILEDLIGDCTNGQQAYVFGRPYAVGSLVQANVAKQVPLDGSLMRIESFMGSVVVPGRGFSGAGPDDAGNPDATASEEWLYATGPVGVLLGEVVVNGAGAEGINRKTNTAVVYAERAAAVYLDTSCCTLAVRVTRD